MVELREHSPGSSRPPMAFRPTLWLFPAPDARSMITLLIATRNAHKLAEIRTILGSGFAYLSLRDLPDAPSVVEDAPTFAGNASKKALSLSHWYSEQPHFLPTASDQVSS